jgi:hypothetical protein
MPNINLFTTNWKATGSSVSVPQYSLTVKVQWTDESGVKREGTHTVLFPNVLNDLPAKYIASAISDMLIEYSVSNLGAREVKE